jgi:N-acetylmuramic acid 6-phosphate etherase
MRRVPTTERVHPRGTDLHALKPRPLLARLHRGDVEAARAVERSLPSLARLAEAAAGALSAGGRLAYAGAGTSGRLGALDAAECPPTFGVARSRILALVAGGPAALSRAVEGAEDDAASGVAAVTRARLGPRDLLVGVSASGRTAWVLAALREARRRGARTALVTSSPEARPPVDHRVLLDTGPELVAGSTRMKAGIAAHMALTLLSTACFVRLGAVDRGLMVALRPSSRKLRDRALRNVCALAGVGPARARAALSRCGWSLGRALRLLSARPRPRRRRR